MASNARGRITWLAGWGAVLAAGLMLSAPTPAQAQFVCVNSANSQDGATATGAGSVACGTSAVAVGRGTSFTPSELGLATSKDLSSLQNTDKKLTEGLAAVASMAQPIILPGQTFAVRAGWGGYDDANALSFSAAGVLAKNLVRDGYGTLVADAGLGVGTNEGEVAGRAGLSFGW